VRWLILLAAGCGFGKQVNVEGMDLASLLDLAGADLAQPPDLSMPMVGGKSLVFTTRGSWAGGLNGTPGLLAADSLCQVSAISAGFGNRTFRAWLSDNNTAAIDRVLGPGPWARRDGPTAFDARPDQLPKVPLNTDENGLLLPTQSYVWTGTLSGGQASGGQNCSGWGTGDAAQRALVGNADEKLQGWTDWTQQGCDQPAHLYCFESP
jgi:hypothetical protein